MSIRTLRSVGGTLAALAVLSTTMARAQTYQIVELEFPPEAVNTAAAAINSQGQVAGRMQVGNNFHPVVWTDGVAKMLAMPPGYPGATATGISDAGDVCGSGWTLGTFGFSAAVVWPGGGAPIFIPTLGGQYSAANGISASGTVVGWTSSYGDFKGQRAYRFDGTLKSAGGRAEPGGSGSVGYAINSSGQIVGHAGATHSQAFVHDSAEGMIAVGTLGGLSSEAKAISDAGHIVGRSDTGAHHPQLEQVFVTHAFLWHKGRMTDLGVLPGLVESEARGVNSSGVVVGRCVGAKFEETPRAFLWKEGTLTDLNSLIPAGSGWTLQYANAINEAGRIVGSGLKDGKTRAFVLIPNQ